MLADHAFIQLIDNHLPSAIAICWVVCSLLLFFIQRFKVNILRITILSGTFALALAFAGNDLVNFIGVPVAGFDAYTIAREAGDTQMLMGALNENVPANFLILLTAGILMILTLWTSKKAMHVSETELSLSAQDDAGQQQYGSSVFSRTIVRAALNVSAGIERVSPETPPRESRLAPFRIRGRGTQRRALRHDPRHGQPDHFGAAESPWPPRSNSRCRPPTSASWWRWVRRSPTARGDAKAPCTAFRAL